MYPGALLSDVSDLNHIGVESRGSRGFTEGSLVHTGRAGANNDTCELMLSDSVLYHILSCLRAHILIFSGDNNTRLVSKRFGNSLYVYRSCDISSAMADKYTYSLHCLVSPFLFRVLSHRADDSLLGHFVIKTRGNVVGSQVILTLFADHGESESFNELSGLNVTGTTVHTREAGQAFVYRLGVHQRFDISCFYHIYELMGVILHFIVGGAGGRAFSATHTFEGIHTTHAEDLLLAAFCFVMHFIPPLRQALWRVTL